MNGILDILKTVGTKYITLSILDILIVSLLFYVVLRAIQNTRTLQLAEGIALYFISVFLVSYLSDKIGLMTLHYLASNLITYSFMFLPYLLVVVFQPELRKWFTGLGKGIRIQETLEDEEDYRAAIEEIVKSVNTMSLNKIGSLIVIEREVPLKEYMETGVEIGAKVKAETLTTIFFPNSPLHDGATIIREGKIAAARCVLPLSMDKELDKENIGTRHRAACGITEESDALAIVVSEETGIISIAVRGKLTRYLSPLELRGMLLVMVRPTMKTKDTVKKG
jgi:diadenylate cyclase